jgi:hypothetical protein
VRHELPEEPVKALVVARDAGEVVYAVAGGRLWVSFDHARHWHPRDLGLPPGGVDAVTLDHSDPTRVWAIGTGELFRSDDRGAHWQPVGRPLPERGAAVRGIIVVDPVIVLATDRGVYRSPDGGQRWEPPSASLPAHLEAGPPVRDPLDPSTIYAGFAVTPSDRLRRQAAEGGSAFARLSVADLAGGAAFLALLTLGALAAVRRLARSRYRTPLGPPSSRRWR